MSDSFGVDPEMWQRFSETERAAIEDAKTKAMRARLIRKATLPRLPKGQLYETPEAATRQVVAVEDLGPRAWEPAVGRGAIARVLEGEGVEVVKTDLHDWQCPGALVGRDFLRERDLLAPVIVTNPPYSGGMAQRFVQHAIGLGAEKVVMVLRLGFMAGNRRRKTLFTPNRPARVWVLSARPTMWRADDPEAKEDGGSMDYAWYVWLRGHGGPTVVDWIGPD